MSEELPISSRNDVDAFMLKLFMNKEDEMVLDNAENNREYVRNKKLDTENFDKFDFTSVEDDFVLIEKKFGPENKPKETSPSEEFRSISRFEESVARFLFG